jgi:hypothetical protein
VRASDETLSARHLRRLARQDVGDMNSTAGRVLVLLGALIL